MKIDYQTIRSNPMINTYLEKGNANLGVIGYTEHSKVHAVKVASVAGKILSDLGYTERDIELVKIAGYMHDIGNCINRHDHAHTGGVMAFQLLTQMGMDSEEIAVVISAIGNHDENTGTAVDIISAALIIADKTDVRRNRVRNSDFATFDIHDRVNYAAKSSQLLIDRDSREIHLHIELDDSICSILDYFEIFLNRMLMCRRAAEMLNCQFKLTTNDSKVL